MTIFVKVRQRHIELANPEGKFIADLLAVSGIALNQHCGGMGRCGGCTIVLEQGEFVVAGKRLMPTENRYRSVRACKTLASSENCVIRIPARSLLERNLSGEVDFEIGSFQVDSRFKKVVITVPPPRLSDHRSDQERMVGALRHVTGLPAIGVPFNITQDLSRALHSGAKKLTATLFKDGTQWRMVALQGGDCGETVYGLALDVGTTTVAGILVDLASGTILRRATRPNQQLVIADDVASRISAAKSDHDVERMRKLVVEDSINAIIEILSHEQGIQPEEVCHFSVAGNTVMTHLMLGLHVTSIGRLPFNMLLRHPSALTVGQLGIRGNHQAPVTIIPAIAGYVGGDITADIYAAALLGKPDGTLMIDVGTNCEMVLKQGSELLCCATPAGPAFEGAGLLHGCRASEGAIAHIVIGEGLDIQITCVGDRAPTGICGSAIIDFIAAGRRCGLINRAGRMDVALLKRWRRYSRVDQAGDGIHACVIVPADSRHEQSEILITEADIAEILQAKAAIFAGIKTLLAQHRLHPDDLVQLILAGGFARHIDIDNAICIGLLPDLPRDRFKVIGNAALAGAYLVLVDGRAEEAMHALPTRPQVIELNLVPGFESDFVDSLFLPATDGHGSAEASGSPAVDRNVACAPPWWLSSG